MKGVLVVDDERLVRKGIISTFPWEAHGFSVIDEVGSGEKALEILRDGHVDLLLTDLTMPGMSGFDLIHQVREEFPSVHIVVLTCHENFEYIQNAMRAEVLDYIVKTEIEDEQIETALARVARKIFEKEKNRSQPLPYTFFSDESAVGGVLLCGKGRHCAPSELISGRISAVEKLMILDIDRLTWFLPAHDHKEIDVILDTCTSLDTQREWVFVRVVGFMRTVNKEICEQLMAFRQTALFYRYEPEKSVYEYTINDNPSENTSDVPEESDDVLALWNGLEWVYSDAAFEFLLSKTRRVQAIRPKLWSIFYSVVAEWDRLLNMGCLQRIHDVFEDLHFWSDWETWIREFRADIKKRIGENASDSIIKNIMCAIEYMKEPSNDALSESQVAKKVSMSRGYFSHCFKRVTGQSFGNYLKELKLERARAMILKSDEPISIIAEKCGFRDPRYFSKIFREYTGVLPNYYRKKKD